MSETMSLRIMSWNLENYTGRRAAHHDQIVDVIRATAPDILCVQELVGEPDNAAENLAALGDATGLDYAIGDRKYGAAGWPPVETLATSANDFHVGVLWNPARVRPANRPGAWREFGGDDLLTRALGTLLFDLPDDHRTLRVASYHATPHSPALREAEAYRVLGALNRGDGVPALLGGDFNGIGSNDVYDKDPYDDCPWFPDRVHQIDVWPPGSVIANRAAGRVFTHPEFGRLVDAAPYLKAEWAPTTGHAPTDQHPYRRIDRILVTPGAEAALVPGSYTVGDSDVSDHRPILVELDPAALPAAP
jgi:endonuclease/exonuclease/phosphatase family metal-dependent hydrolase